MNWQVLICLSKSSEHIVLRKGQGSWFDGDLHHTDELPDLG
jgi:hypothetical protein